MSRRAIRPLINPPPTMTAAIVHSPAPIQLSKRHEPNDDHAKNPNSAAANAIRATATGKAFLEAKAITVPTNNARTRMTKGAGLNIGVTYPAPP